MPIYRFHDAHNGRPLSDGGIVLPSDGAARLAALGFASELLAAEPVMLWRVGQWRVEVTDDAGSLLFTVITLAVDAPRRRLRETDELEFAPVDE